MLPEFGDAVPEARERALRGAGFEKPLVGDFEESFGAAASFGGGIAQARRDEALGFKAFERGVDAAEGGFTPGALFDFAGDGDAVGFVLKADEGQEDHEFEFA